MPRLRAGCFLTGRCALVRHCSGVANGTAPIERVGNSAASASMLSRQYPQLVFSISIDSYQSQDGEVFPVATYHFKDICIGPPQDVRFRSTCYPLVTVASTKERDRVVSALHDGLMRRPSSKLMVLAGVGWNGKSHNLVQLVLRLRAQGHVVAFVHDMGTWLQDPLHVLQELLFGIEVLTRRMQKGGDSAAAETIIEDVRSALRDAFARSIAPHHMQPLDKLVDMVRRERRRVHDRTFSEVYAVAKEMFINVVLKADALSNWCKAVIHVFQTRHVARKVFLVVDHIHFDGVYDRPSVHAHMISKFKRSAIFDGTVLSALANEDWQARGIATSPEDERQTIVTQLSECLPFDCARLLLPNIRKLTKNGAVATYVKETLGGFPKCWRWASRAVETEVITSKRNPWAATSEGLSEGEEASVLKALERRANSEVTRQLTQFSNTLTPLDRSRFAVALRQGSLGNGVIPRYDRVFFEEVRCQAREQPRYLREIFPAARLHALRIFPLPTDKI